MDPTARFVSFLTRRTSWSEGHVFAFAPEQIDVAEGMRTAVAIGAILAAQMLSGIPDLAYGAVAAFWTALCDPRGPKPQRLKAMVTFALLGGGIISVASYAAHWGIYAGAEVLFILVFLCGLMRSSKPAYGPMPSQIGLITSIAAVVGVSAPGALSDAVGLGACFLLGAASYGLLAMVIWQDRSPNMWTLTLVAIFTRLEDALQTLLELDAGGSNDEGEWRRFDSLLHRAVRFSLERGRQTVTRLAVFHGHYCETIDMAGRIFSALVALAYIRRTSLVAFDRQSERPVLEKLRTLLQLMAREAASIKPNGDAVMAEVDALVTILRGRDDFFSRAVTLAADAIRTIAGHWTRSDLQSTETATDPVPTMSGPPFAVWRSSLRTAVAVLISYAVGLVFDLSLAYWGAIATLVVMQPMVSNTWLRVLERAAGTMIGGLIAVASISWATAHWQMALVIVPLSALVIALRLVNYGLFVIFLTPLFMLLTDYANPVDDLVWERVQNEARGACIAILAGLLLWPERERESLTNAVSTAVRANMAYVIATLRADGRSPELGRLQRDAGVASSRLEVIYERMWLEGRRRSPIMDPLHRITADLRAVCGVATVLSLWHPYGSDNSQATTADVYEAVAAAMERRLLLPEKVEFPTRLAADHPGLARAVADLVDAVEDYSAKARPRRERAA